MRSAHTKRRGRERGFSILEMMLATIILLVGLVAVAQLVPASILMNYRNRNDSAALVFAQRELDQFLDQPISLPAPFTDALGNTCSLGDPATPNIIQPNSSSVVVINNQAIINFGAAPVANYSFYLSGPRRSQRRRLRCSLGGNTHWQWHYRLQQAFYPRSAAIGWERLFSANHPGYHGAEMKRRRGKRQQAGFTLIELLTALGIFLIVCGAAFSLLGSSQQRQGRKPMY